jgi:hypothetical protein
MQKIGNVRLPQPRLPCQKRYAQCPALNPALQFNPNPLLQLRKVHVENSLAAMGQETQTFLSEM